jgi:hypothetical protein
MHCFQLNIYSTFKFCASIDGHGFFSTLGLVSENEIVGKVRWNRSEEDLIDLFPVTNRFLDLAHQIA